MSVRLADFSIPVHSLGPDLELLANVLMLAAAPSFVVDLTGHIVDANQIGADLLGLQGTSWAGFSLVSIVHPEDAPLAHQQAQGLLAGTTRTAFAERRWRHSSGKFVWVSLSLKLIADTEGTPTFFFLQAVNIDDHKLTERALAESERRWNFALESAGQGVWEADRSIDHVYYSPTWKKLRGFDVTSNIDSSEAAWLARIHPRDRERVRTIVRRQNTGEIARNAFEYREMHQRGHYIWIQSRGAPIEFGPDGNPTRIIGTDTDITDFKNAEHQSRTLTHRLELAMKVSKIGVFEADLETGALLYDRPLHELFGIPLDRTVLSAEDFENALHPDDAKRIVGDIATAVECQGIFNGKFRIQRPDGSIRTVMSHATYFEDSDGNRKFIGANWDVTEDVMLAEGLQAANALAESRYAELKLANEKIKHLALHDALTGLPNRRYLELMMNRSGDTSDDRIAALHIDLDRFKQINDSLGHAAGDAVLKHVAAFLSRTVGSENFVARTGGDEFTVLCTGTLTEDHLSKLAQQIIAGLGVPFRYHGLSCSFGCSIGIAKQERKSLNAERLLIEADSALYGAKESGRGRIEFFTESLRAEIALAKRTTDDLTRAVRDREFVPFYQPIVDAASFRIAGIEALARWRHPTEGMLLPARFLKSAHDLNVLADIDGQILEQAVKDFKFWQTQDLGITSVSVNVSFHRLQGVELLASLAKISFAPGTLVFEFLESIFLDDTGDEFETNINGIKSLGIGIDIDDFGTGHTSFLSLIRLRPRRFKIDRQLVLPIVEHKEQREIVKSLIGIGRTLGIQVVAEGVETMEHAHLLKELGCDYLQGFAFARPMDAEALTSWCLSTGHGN